MAKNAVLTEYRIKSNTLDSPLRIALVTDIHERNADDILGLLEKSKPDLIAVAGDTFERYDYEDDEPKHVNPLKTMVFITAFLIDRSIKLLSKDKNLPDPENSYRFLREASKLAPVYMSLGNHEEQLSEEDLIFLKKNNIQLLDNSDAVFLFKGREIPIGGLSTDFDEDWLEGFSKKQGIKILLCHHPEYYEPMIKRGNIGLILAGHTHGGQIRIFGKGLLASSVGLFPKYDRGVFDDRLVVSAGCSNPVSVPRLNNPRELVIIDLVPQNLI